MRPSRTTTSPCPSRRVMETLPVRLFRARLAQSIWNNTRCGSKASTAPLGPTVSARTSVRGPIWALPYVVEPLAEHLQQIADCVNGLLQGELDRSVGPSKDLGLLDQPTTRLFNGRQLLLGGTLLSSLEPDERFPALTGVTFNVRSGSTFAIIGRNGSGKSTLLKVIAGISKPDTGTAFFALVDEDQPGPRLPSAPS